MFSMHNLFVSVLITWVSGRSGRKAVYAAASSFDSSSVIEPGVSELILRIFSHV
jgi:hypothetical protein